MGDWAELFWVRTPNLEVKAEIARGWRGEVNMEEESG